MTLNKRQKKAYARQERAYQLRKKGQLWDDIAAELDYHDHQNARRAAKEAAERRGWGWPLPAVKKPRGGPLDAITKRQWESMTNKAIGDLIGMSGQAVGRYRKRHDKPVADNRQKSKKTWQEEGTHRVSVLAKVGDAKWRTSTNMALAREYGIEHQSVAEYRTMHGKPASPSAPGVTQQWQEK